MVAMSVLWVQRNRWVAAALAVPGRYERLTEGDTAACHGLQAQVLDALAIECQCLLSIHLYKRSSTFSVKSAVLEELFHSVTRSYHPEMRRTVGETWELDGVNV